MNDTTEQLPVLVKSLMRSQAYQHPVSDIKLVETHISWVILTGMYVYKIKKPLNLGFLDFSTLENRHFYCEEELRLNKRLAPVIYLSVESIRGTAEAPTLTGDDEIIEYAVKMVQFPQDAQFDRLLEREMLSANHIDALADLIARFHQQVEVADNQSLYGDLKHVYSPVEENYRQIRLFNIDKNYSNMLEETESWSQSACEKLAAVLSGRKRDGFIRECHGDLHLRNLAWYQEQPVAFDCLEFNASLRWIDVMSEVAFLVMDLEYRQQNRFATRFLNQYLQTTGDYAGLAVLRFYLVYRALVRAKVEVIRLQQKGLSQTEERTVKQEFKDYLKLAASYTRKTDAQLMITRGMSASGKSTITQPLMEQLGAIRIRSDVERKRLFIADGDEDKALGINEGIYTEAASEKTYKKLLELAEKIIDAGFSVIVDAAFLQERQRKPFQQLSVKKHIPYRILEFQASEQILRQRISQRKSDVSDADLSVLEYQLKEWIPLEESERKYCIEINTETWPEINTIIDTIAVDRELPPPL